MHQYRYWVMGLLSVGVGGFVAMQPRQATAFAGDVLTSAPDPYDRINERIVPVAGSPLLVATWSEPDDSDLMTSFYALAPDGLQFGPPQPISNRMHLRYADFDPLGGNPTIPANLAADHSNRLHLVQFAAPIQPEFRGPLTAAGARIVKYMPDNAYLVNIQPGAARVLAALPFVRWVGEYHPAYKLEEQLLAEIGSGAPVPARAYSLWLAQRGSASQDSVSALIGSLGGTNIVRTIGLRMEATLTLAQLLSVVRHNEVLWIDLVTPRSPDMDVIRTLWGANYIEGLGGYSGEGVRGEVMDGGFLSTHVDFQARPPILHLGNNADNSHGTSTTGIVFGTGTGNPQGRGLLPDAQGVFSTYYNLTDRFQETADLVNPAGPYRCVFQSNSWGDAQTTQYTSISADMDDLLFANDLLVCQSQSNTGTQSSRPQAWAKNIVSIGGAYHFNNTNTTDDAWQFGASIGPASDGSQKPDLCQAYDAIFCPTTPQNTSYTNNFGGTSGATPISAGHFGLWFQLWASGVFGNPTTTGDVFDERPHMTTSKAAMINMAFRYPLTQSDITRYVQGWGVANIKSLYDARNNFFYVDESDVLTQGQTATYNFNVAAGTPYFRATMIYADPAAVPGASRLRVNDFDLKVTAPDGTIYWGNHGLVTSNNSTSGGSADSLNTVENVFLDNPAVGSWQVDVIATSIVEDGHVETPAIDGDFALVVTGVPPVPPALHVTLLSGPSGFVAPGTAPVVTAGIQPGTETVVPGTELLHYRYSSSGGFATITLNDQGGGAYTATLPPIACGDAPQYYLSAQGSGGTVVNAPASGASAPFTFQVGAQTHVFDDNFESNQGWTAGAPGDTATGGIWERVAPSLTTAQPGADHSDVGTLCFVTDGGGGRVNQHDVDGGNTTLLSPAFNLAGAQQARISYWRWYYNGNAARSRRNVDTFRVDISNDGGTTWFNAETIGPAGTEVNGGWFSHEIVVSDFVTPTANVRIRFVASDFGSGSPVEALVDDVSVTAVTCNLPRPGDLNGDNAVDLADLAALLANFGVSDGARLSQGDLNNDGRVDLADLAGLLAVYGQ